MHSGIHLARRSQYAVELPSYERIFTLSLDFGMRGQHKIRLKIPSSLAREISGRDDAFRIRVYSSYFAGRIHIEASH